MSLTIPNTTISSQSYLPAASFAGTDVLAQGYFTVANNPVFVQMLHGAYGQPRPGSETYLPPGTYPLAAGERDVHTGLSRDPISGIRFRAATTATPSPQVFGTLFYPGEAQILAGQPFAGAVSPSGGISQTGVLDIQTVSSGLVLVNNGEAAPLTLVTFASLTFDGATQVMIDWTWEDAQFTAANNANEFGVNLWDGAVDLGRILHGQVQPAIGPVYGRTLITPPAGATAYRLRAWNATNTYNIRTGVGGVGTPRAAIGAIQTFS